MTFRPERFIATETHAPERDVHTAVFGYGRRICPGMNLAEASIFILCARTLAAFDVTKAVDEESGVEITPPVEYDSGTICHPKPFKCSIKPRSLKAEALIRAYQHA